MRIVITGATGSLGAYLTRWFAGKGHEVFALGRMENPPARLLACAKYIRADITKPFEMPDADVCIHAAALADDKANAQDLFAANVLGTENVIRAAANCKTFIHISSSSVYSPSDQLITEEMAEWNAMGKLTPYGKSKLLAEEKVQTTSRHSSTFILRPRGIYGIGDKVLLPRLLGLVKNEKFIRAGKMNVTISMTHFSNFAWAIECCMYSDKTGLNVYNISDAKPYVLYDVLKKIMLEIHGRELPEKKVPLWVLKTMAGLKIGDVTPMFINTVSRNMSLDISKIKREMDYNSYTHFDQVLKHVAQWVKDNGGVEVIKRGDPGLAWA